ncbi:hypothetical protein Tco_1536834 [Tanacetum coccineum]
MMMRVGVLCLHPLVCSLFTVSDLFLLYVEMDLFTFINHADPTKVWIGERKVAKGEVPLLQLTRGHIVLLSGVNDHVNVDVEGAGNDGVNGEGSDATAADQTEQDDQVIQIGGIDIVSDDETQAIVADKPKRLRKNRKDADGASGSGLPPNVDTTKVQIEEQEVAEGEVSLLQLTRGRVVPLAGVNDQIRGIDIVADDETHAIVSDKLKRLRKKRKAADGASGSGLPPKKLREDHDVYGDAGASTAGKSHAVLQGLLDRSTLATEIGATAAATIPFVTSSVTPTPEREGGGHEDSVAGPNL